MILSLLKEAMSREDTSMQAPSNASSQGIHSFAQKHKDFER